MAQPRAVFSVQDLVNALGEQTIMDTCDDFRWKDPPRVLAGDILKLVVKRANAIVLSYLPTTYGDTAPKQTPDYPDDELSDLLRDCGLRFATCLLYQRRPAWMKQNGYLESHGPGGNVERGAHTQMKQIQASIQRVHATDNPPETKPRNVGGVFHDDGPKITIASSVSSYEDPTGDW